MQNGIITNNEVINQFIIESVLITPIEKIIKQLENGEFRNCDIKWLDNKMENFIKFAGETLGLKVIAPSQVGSKSYTIINSYVTKVYQDKFTTLLNYFKTF